MTDEPMLELGRQRTPAAPPVRLPARALLRHMMALGSSGSGKTVLAKVVVEEVVRAGIPALLLDPQGDLCSLALAADDPELARAFAEQCDVVIFTPASDKGIALGADPLAATLASAIDEESWTRAAANIAALLGYSTEDDDGQGCVAVLDTVLRELAERGQPATNLRALTEHLSSLDDAGLAPYAKFWELKPLRQAIRKLARLDVGPRRKLFDGGLPLDIDVLLRTAVPEGKTRVAIIHLNSLHQQEDKEFLVAVVAERLYAWMLANPTPEPQLLFYLDEIAPFLPPVRKPQCKDALQLLFKQARKYGVCCLMATQNPGDVDYRSMAQFGTWALGRLTTRQDLEKLKPTVKSLAPVTCDAVMAELPRLEPGQFVLLSPDHFAEPTGLQTRWLYTQHETLDEARIAELTDERWRSRFASALDREAEPEPEPEPAPRVEPAAKPKRPSKDEAATSQREAQLELLRTHGPLDVKRFAELLGCSETTARRALKLLVDEGIVGDFKRGRSCSYWVLDTGLRPDLEMPASVLVAAPGLGQEQAALLGRGFLRSSLLGLGGPAETLVETLLVHKLLWRVDFEERITAGLLGRLFGPGFEDRIGSVYLHPQTLAIVTWDRSRGLRFIGEPGEHASEVHDLDGVVQWSELPPAHLNLDDAEWSSRRPEADVRSAFASRWQAKIGAVSPCFLPIWKLTIQRHEPAGLRVVLLDAIAGHPIDWPGG
jgi:hypothetical protein